MRSPNKPRTRNKPGRRSPGNVINRVFESTGPEGKVRGNPQQIIEKYLALSRDALLGGDRVASENFAQHSEHYARLLNEAQREIEARREQQENQNPQRRFDHERRTQPHPGNGEATAGGPMRVGNPLDGDLVDTPENEPLNIIGTQAPDVIAQRKKRPDIEANASG